MNLTDITPIQCTLMDQYDEAMKALHKVILVDGRASEIRAAQEKVMTTRNRIAQTFIDHSWCGVPAESRR